MNKTLSTYTVRLLVLLSLLLNWSCADDFSSPTPVIDSDMATLTLIIPEPHLNTSRAADNSALGNIGSIEAGEGKINSLWFFAYGIDGTKTDIITPLTPEGSKLTNDYSSYAVEIPAGKYRIYAVANVDGLGRNTSEDDLKNVILKYSADAMPEPEKGLPMACMEEITVDIAAAETREVFIDLTFLCVKLRYTILFDNAANGFSHNTFAGNPIKITSVRAENISDRTSLTSYDTPSGTGVFDIDNVDGNHCQYPSDIDRFLEMNWNSIKDNSPSDNNLAPIEETDLDDNRRAYQGIIYLPENRNTEKPTTLIFEASADNGNTYQYIVELPPASDAHTDKETDSDKDGMLQRGHFYDIIGKITTIGERFDIIAGIAPWTLQTVAYSLHGPYFLHIDKTAIQVTAGIETRIAYDTDAGQLTFDSPEYEGKKLFDIKTVEENGIRYISVNINPEVNASEGTNFNSSFYINAANLRKRIEVNPVSLEPYLNVDPQVIEINIGEYISSGIYDGDIDINFSTNLHNVTITKSEEWDNASQSLIFEGETIHASSSGTNNLKFTEMNGGDFWKSEQTLTLKYTASDNGKILEKEVRIHIVPNVIDYIIHFRPGVGWTSPHIYVYQCLQLPADLAQNASKPVGYKNGDNSNDALNYFAALEYSFTGKIAFKGWDGYGGVENNNPVSTSQSSPRYGFFIPENSWEWFPGDDKNPNKENFAKHYYTDMDFCATYRETLTCGDCKNNNYNNTWPGIQMVEEINGWWKFILTGIATPGKALIMFTDTHSGSALRYPGHAEVGVPLFDYPNHEGWFDYACEKRQFTPENPDANRPTLRIYFPANASGDHHIHVWASETSWGTAWETNEGIFDDETGYYYQDVPYLSNWNENIDIFLQLYKSGKGEDNRNFRISQFETIGSNIRAITIDSNGNLASQGKPKPFETKTYRIYWQPESYANFNKIHIWNESGTPLYDWNNEKETYHDTEYIDGREYRYYEFRNSESWNPSRINYIIFDSDRPGENDPRKTGEAAMSQCEISNKYIAP